MHIKKHHSRLLTSSQIDRADRILDARIKSRTPLAYLLNEAWLGRHRFFVDQRVIIPRSFIAEFIETGLAQWLPARRKKLRALDLCTGSGCLAIVLAKTFRGMHVDAVDVSGPALEVAHVNIKRHHLQSRTRAILSDLLTGIPESVRYDLIVSNPPYVRTSSMRALPMEYRHEPTLALAGGTDGLELVSRILDSARQYLTPKGVLVLEVGHNKKAMEKTFPRLPILWLDTLSSEGMVALIEAKDIPERSKPRGQKRGKT